MTFTLRTDRTLARAGASSRRYVLVSILAPEAPARVERLPVNVALVLDRSGSMAGERKFAIARQATERALGMLQRDDRFTLVVYDEQVEVLAPSTPATPEAKRRALESLRGIEPRGFTDLCGGWMRGCEQIAEHLAEDGVARALLLTDGLANHGVTDRQTLARHAGELRRRGVATSTFGVGEDFDERLLRDMAHEGGGNFYFIESPAQIADLLTSELGEALEVVVRHAALEVVLPHGADVELLNRFRVTRERGEGGLRVELGDLVSRQDVQVAFAVRLPRGEIGRTSHLRVSMTGDGAFPAGEEGVVSWTYASHADNDRQPRDRVVDREVAGLYAARARAAATEANRHGDWDRAREVLERTAARIESYAGEDPTLLRIARELRGEVGIYAEQVMSPMMLKGTFFLAETMSKGRIGSGQARRRP